MRKPNYNQAKKQKEQARLQRQQEKLQKRATRPEEGDADSQATQDTPAANSDAGTQSPA